MALYVFAATNALFQRQRLYNNVLIIMCKYITRDDEIIDRIIKTMLYRHFHVIFYVVNLSINQYCLRLEFTMIREMQRKRRASLDN